MKKNLVIKTVRAAYEAYMNQRIQKGLWDYDTTVQDCFYAGWRQGWAACERAVLSSSGKNGVVFLDGRESQPMDLLVSVATDGSTSIRMRFRKGVWVKGPGQKLKWLYRIFSGPGKAFFDNPEVAAMAKAYLVLDKQLRAMAPGPWQEIAEPEPKAPSVPLVSCCKCGAGTAWPTRKGTCPKCQHRTCTSCKG